MKIQILSGKMWATATLALLMPLACAAGMPPHQEIPPGGPGPHGATADSAMPGPHFLRGIALSEAQKDQIFAIHHDLAPALRNQEKELRQAQEGLQIIIMSAPPDEARLRALTESIARATQQITLLRARAEQKIYGLLTPVQRKQIEEMMQDRQPGPSGPEGGKGGLQLPAGRPSLLPPR